MEHVSPRRLLILGAGFSRPAGLPLSVELLDLVLPELARFQGQETHLHRSLAEYKRFKEATTGAVPELVDIEDFAAFLDYQHAFGLLGSDTWSEEGNRDQLLLRWGIGRVLHRAMPSPADIPDLYLEFANRLRPGDVVVTFNYDLVLERSLEGVEKPYRRFPGRLTEAGPTGGIVDTERDGTEVTIIKPHGSIDWVSKQPYERHLRYMERAVPDHDGRRFVEERDHLFGPNACSSTHPLVEGPRLDDDPLRHIHVIEHLDSYYENRQVWYSHPPLVLAPSVAKQLYGASLRGLWDGLAVAGFGWGGISVIGYSLPRADPYSLQVLYEVVRGYETGLNDPGWRIGPMNAIAVVDRRASESARDDLRHRYRFMPTDHTRFYYDGFDRESLDLVFPDSPVAMPGLESN